MLTRCVEKGREKCDHYWPYDTQPVYYGDIQVTILNESHYPDWNVSEFRICRVSHVACVPSVVVTISFIAMFSCIFFFLIFHVG